MQFRALSAEAARLAELLVPPPSTGPSKRPRTAEKKRRQKQHKADADLADEVNGNGAA
jgi:hypothetical protein